MAEFHFIRQEWLLLFIPFGAIFGLLLHKRLSRRNWETVCDRDLWPYVLLEKPSTQTRWRLLWFAMAGILAILALAGPTWQRLPSPVFRSESAVVIILDLSASMDAADVKPTRLERARFKIKDILMRRKDGQTALVVYAGDAFTVTPLTGDTDTISNHLSGLKTSLMPVGGSDTEKALKHAMGLLRQAGSTGGHLVLVTDGVDAAQSNDMARRLKSESFRLSVLGVGTESGAPIPQAQGGFLKDSAGNIVIPKVRIAELKELARNGGGVFHLLTVDNRDINAIDAIIGRRQLASYKDSDGITIDQWQEFGPWLLLPLLPIAAFAFRKGLIAGVALMLILPCGDVWALDWADLWATKDQQADRAYKRGESRKAASLFENRRWKGAVEYSSGNYAETVETLGSMDDSDSLYNKGNALARLGRYQQALEAYGQALKKQPKHGDAIHNKRIVEEQLRQQQQNQSQNTPQDSSNTDPKSKNSEQQNPNSEQSADAEENPSGQQQQEEEAAAQDAGDSSSKHNGEQTSDRKEDGMNSQESPEQPSASRSENGEGSDKEDEQMASGLKPMENDQPDESQQANEQWLRRIPDDPGKLFREKFRYQYRRRQQKNSGDMQW